MEDGDHVKEVSVDENEVDQAESNRGSINEQHGRNNLTTKEEDILHERQSENPVEAVNNKLNVDDDRVSESDPVADSDIEYGSPGTGLVVEHDGGTDFE